MARELVRLGFTDWWVVRVLIVALLTALCVGVCWMVVSAMKGRWLGLIKLVLMNVAGWICLILGLLVVAYLYQVVVLDGFEWLFCDGWCGMDDSESYDQ